MNEKGHNHVEDDEDCLHQKNTPTAAPSRAAGVEEGACLANSGRMRVLERATVPGGFDTCPVTCHGPPWNGTSEHEYRGVLAVRQIPPPATSFLYVCLSVCLCLCLSLRLCLGVCVCWGHSQTSTAPHTSPTPRGDNPKPKAALAGSRDGVASSVSRPLRGHCEEPTFIKTPSHKTHPDGTSLALHGLTIFSSTMTATLSRLSPNRDRSSTRR